MKHWEDYAMIDADNFISNMNGDINGNYNKDIFKSRLEEINNNINNLNSEIDKWKGYKKFNRYDVIAIIITSFFALINSSSCLIGITWVIVYRKLIVSKIIVPHEIKDLKKDLKCEQKKRKQEIERFEKFEEKRKEMLKDDKDYKKIRKNLLERIDDLDKEELLAIRTVVTEYTTNKDIPRQVGNIVQFLTEIQVGDVEIKDTSLYNMQMDDEANSKGKSKDKVYYINGQKLD